MLWNQSPRFGEIYPPPGAQAVLSILYYQLAWRLRKANLGHDEYEDLGPSPVVFYQFR